MHPRRLLGLALAIPLSLALGSSSALASETTVRSYALPSGGSLELDVPLRWREDVGWTEGDHRPRITFRPETGDGFVATLTVLAPPAEKPEGFGTSGWLHAVVEDSARKGLAVDDGRELMLEQIGDARAVGWYYSVTDDSLPDPPPKGTYRVMTQGATAAGDVVLTATFLTQKAWGPDIDEAIALLRTARTSGRAPDTWRAPNATVLARGTEGERYDLEVPDDFEREGSSPLELRDRLSGALFRVDVRDGRSDVHSELRRLVTQMDLRAPNAWTQRQKTLATVAGRTAARFAAVDDVHDEYVEQVAIPLKDAVLTATWRVSPTVSRSASTRLDLLLKALTIHPDQ